MRSAGIHILLVLSTMAGVAASHAGIRAAPGKARATAQGTASITGTLYVSTGGKDDNAGTIAEPLATPARAVAVASPGDTIFMRGGIYNLATSVLVAKPGLTLRSFGGESAHLRGPIDERKSLTSVIVITASNVALIGLELEGGSYYGVKVDAEPGHHTTGVLVRSCRIHDTGRDCIKTFNADQLVIEDCDIGRSGRRDPSDAEGLDSIGSIGVIIRRCRIHDTATNGLYLKGGARNGLVEQCRVENIAGFAGILLGEDTDAEFMRDGARYEAIDCVARNNIVINTAAAGLATYSGSNIRFENNTLYNVAEKIQAAFWIVTNSRNVPAERIRLVNNIAVMSGARPFVFVKNLAGALDCDWNIYFNSGASQKFVKEVTGTSDLYSQWRFTEWRSVMGLDSHSMVADPLLNSEDSYRPMPGSPAIGRGRAIPGVSADYNGAARRSGEACDIGAVQSALEHGEGAVNP